MKPLLASSAARRLATHGGELGVERDRLRGVAGEAIEDEALARVIGGKALLHKVDDELVGNELASIHVLLGRDAELGLSLDGGTKQVARGDVGNAEIGDEALGLRTLAGARGALQHDVHVRILLWPT